LAKNCRTVEDIQGIIKELFKDTVQSVLEAEMEEYLGYEIILIHYSNVFTHEN
jgi:putative transposase